MHLKSFKELKAHGPKLYKSEFGLPAYKNKDGEEVYVLNIPVKLDNIKQETPLKEDEKNYYFEGYASTWTLDLGDDIIRPGAFKDSLKVRKPKVLAFHDPDILAGISMEEFEDEIGLRVRGSIPKDGGNTPFIVPYMGVGGIDSLSIGFRIARDEDGDLEMDFVNGVRIIKKIELYEYSFVTFPMNPAAKVGLGLDPEALPRLLGEDLPLPVITGGDDEEEIIVDGKSFKVCESAKSKVVNLISRYEKNLESDDSEEEFKFESIRDIENILLNEFGATAKEAKALISGVKTLSNTRDDADDDITEEQAGEMLKSLGVDSDETKDEDISDDDLETLLKLPMFSE